MTIMTRMLLALLLVLLYTYIGSGIKVASFNVNVDRFAPSTRFVRSSQVIAEIARRNDIVLVQGVQKKWANGLLQTLNRSPGYSFALAIGQSNETSAQKQCHENAYFYQTGNVRLLNVFCYKSEAYETSSVLVKDLKNGLPEFFILLYSNDTLEVSHLTDAINTTVVTFGTDKGIVIKSECSTMLSKDFELVPQTYNTAADKPCAWTSSRIVAYKSLMHEAKDHSAGQLRSPGGGRVLRSSSDAKTAGTAAGAALGCIAIFMTILCAICCCVDRRCGYSRISNRSG